MSHLAVVELLLLLYKVSIFRMSYHHLLAEVDRVSLHLVLLALLFMEQEIVLHAVASFVGVASGSDHALLSLVDGTGFIVVGVHGVSFGLKCLHLGFVNKGSFLLLSSLYRYDSIDHLFSLVIELN